MRRVFVTGGTGLLGGSVIRRLRERGVDVVALARDRAKAERVLGDVDVRWVIGDVLRVEGFADDLAGCDAVIHAAAYFRETYQPGNHGDALHQVNVEATARLLREADARGVSRFVHIGSAAAVGRNPDGSPGDEGSPTSALARQSAYVRSKASRPFEHTVRDAVAWHSRDGA